MSTQDSGLIDLFAIHKEEEARLSAAPSAPPPAVSLDVGRSTGPVTDEDLEGFEAAQAASRRRTKIIGGVIGGLAVLGAIIGAIAVGGSNAKEPAKAAAAEPPPAALTAPPPPAVTAPPPAATPAPTAKADKPEKSDYTRSTAAAAYAASQGKKRPARGPARSAGGGTKLQKVQSSGIN